MIIHEIRTKENENKIMQVKGCYDKKTCEIEIRDIAVHDGAKVTMSTEELNEYIGLLLHVQSKLRKP